MEHRDADCIVVSLEVDVQKGAAANEEAHPSSEGLTYTFENEFVKKADKRLSPERTFRSLIVTLFVIDDCILESHVVEFLHHRALGFDAGLDGLLETLCERRHRKHDGRADCLDCRRNVTEAVARNGCK